MQLDQQPVAPRLRDELAHRVFSLPDVEERPSAISVPGARALWLKDDVIPAGPDVFMIGREFAHLHPEPDQSLHMILPEALVEPVVGGGWGELHPVASLGLIPATAVMVFAPRDDQEIEIVYQLVSASYTNAGGRL